MGKSSRMCVCVCVCACACACACEEESQVSNNPYWLLRYIPFIQLVYDVVVTRNHWNIYGRQLRIFIKENMICIWFFMATILRRGLNISTWSVMKWCECESFAVKKNTAAADEGLNRWTYQTLPAMELMNYGKRCKLAWKFENFAASL